MLSHRAETIEDDARTPIATEAAAQYAVVKPTAVPSRPGGTGPNIVQYALATSQPKGWPKGLPSWPWRCAQSRNAACAQYDSR